MLHYRPKGCFQWRDPKSSHLRRPSFGGLSETDCPPFSLAFEPSMRREAPPDPECPVRSESLVLKRLIPLAGPAAPNGTNNLWYARRPNFWRSVEAFVIAVVFACLLVRASMDRLSRLYRGPTLPSEMVEQRTPSQKPNQVAAVLPFSGPFSEKAIAKLGRLESTQRSQADITAEDTVIRYDQHSADRFQGKPTASLTRASGPVQTPYDLLFADPPEMIRPNIIAHAWSDVFSGVLSR